MKNDVKPPVPKKGVRYGNRDNGPTVLETYPSPDFIEPDFGPVQGIFRKDGTSGPLTPEERTFYETYRVEKLARNTAIRVREGLPADGSGDAEWNARRFKRKPVGGSPK